MYLKVGYSKTFVHVDEVSDALKGDVDGADQNFGVRGFPERILLCSKGKEMDFSRSTLSGPEIAVEGPDDVICIMSLGMMQ